MSMKQLVPIPADVITKRVEYSSLLRLSRNIAVFMRFRMITSLLGQSRVVKLLVLLLDAAAVFIGTLTKIVNCREKLLDLQLRLVSVGTLVPIRQ
ncbi:hypothetical protein TNCT_632171 [Trichonephila clavata]|uniref:Uncharacterized protein n=1 Tax=Trichonephila clavata TaxID=2740835 RepID=A0A8X6LP32_TRICU|nr:hypothetical protein TNCT_632171 [Trichonephila clavata]